MICKFYFTKDIQDTLEIKQEIHWKLKYVQSMFIAPNCNENPYYQIVGFYVNVKLVFLKMLN